MQTKGIEFDLIVSIVEKGRACEVVAASKKAGAEGGTILSGRGSGIHDNKKVFGILVEPEKELVLTLVDRTIAPQTLQTISSALQLDQPGNGIAFLLKVEETAGICHLCHLQKVVKPEKA
jgi:nitrogen regulatory protein PII